MLPAFFLAVATAPELGVRDFADWQYYWTWACLIFHFGIGLYLLLAPSRRAGWALAAFACVFWVLNRWSMYVLLVRHVDGLALLFFLGSLLLLGSRPGGARLLFGLSLAVKHVALPVVPLYLIWEHQACPRGLAWKRTGGALVQIAAVPVLLSLPFLVWNPSGFVGSVLFSATRLPESNVSAASFDEHFEIDGPMGKLPIFALTALVYLAAMSCRLRRFGAVLLVLAVFTDFNSVAFPQYFAWVVPFVPLAAIEWLEPEDGKVN